MWAIEQKMTYLEGEEQYETEYIDARRFLLVLKEVQKRIEGAEGGMKDAEQLLNIPDN